MVDNTILTKYLPGIIINNPAISDCFIDAILKDIGLRNCLIKAVKKIAQEKESELLPWGDGVHWSWKGRHGPGMTKWVKLGEKKYPIIWVLGKLYPEKQNENKTDDAKNFFKALGLEISN
jgi:hypothetical protein